MGVASRHTASSSRPSMTGACVARAAVTLFGGGAGGSAWRWAGRPLADCVTNVTAARNGNPRNMTSPVVSWLDDETPEKVVSGRHDLLPRLDTNRTVSAGRFPHPGTDGDARASEYDRLNGVWPRIDRDRRRTEDEVVLPRLGRRVHHDDDHGAVRVHERGYEQHAAARRRDNPPRARTNEFREVADVVVRIGVDELAGARVGMDRRKT